MWQSLSLSFYFLFSVCCLCFSLLFSFSQLPTDYLHMFQNSIFIYLQFFKCTCVVFGSCSITLDVLNLSKSMDIVILSVQVKYRKLIYLHVYLPSPVYNKIVLTIFYIYLYQSFIIFASMIKHNLETDLRGNFKRFHF